jgi:hypothetical protein
LIPSSDEFMRTETLNPFVFSEIPSTSPNMIYHFAHDRVQQAAAHLISAKDCRVVHGQIAEVSHIIQEDLGKKQLRRG